MGQQTQRKYPNSQNNSQRPPFLNNYRKKANISSLAYPYVIIFKIHLSLNVLSESPNQRSSMPESLMEQELVLPEQKEPHSLLLCD